MQLFKISTDRKTLEKIAGSTLSAQGFNEPQDLESWIINYNEAIFGRDILWITRQDFLNTDQRSDLVGIDSTGNLVVCELKQGTLTDQAIIQALGYTSEYSKFDLDQLASKFLEHIEKRHVVAFLERAEKAHSTGDLVTTIEDAKQAINTKITKDKVGADVIINETQIVILVGEDFAPNSLVIVDYLNNSSDALSYLIECWRYQLFPLGGNQFQIAFEQILPPPNIRYQIEEKREESRARKYARDPQRINFMYWFVGQIVASPDFEAWRSPGASYYCNVIKKSHEASVFLFDIYGEHPRLTFAEGLRADIVHQDFSAGSSVQNNKVVVELTKFGFQPSADLVASIKTLVSTALGVGG